MNPYWLKKNPFHLNPYFAQDYENLVKWYNDDPEKAAEFLNKYDELSDKFYEWLGDQ